MAASGFADGLRARSCLIDPDGWHILALSPKILVIYNILRVFQVLQSIGDMNEITATTTARPSDRFLKQNTRRVCENIAIHDDGQTPLQVFDEFMC